MFGSKEPQTQQRCSRRLLFICPLICSVFSRMNQRDTSFSPSSLPQPSSLCAARNEAEPRGNRFDCCLSWLSLSAATEGTRTPDLHGLAAPSPNLYFCIVLSPHTCHLECFAVPHRFFPPSFNCRFPRRRGHVLQLCILRVAAATQDNYRCRKSHSADWNINESCREINK